jgi:hypothetical protein
MPVGQNAQRKLRSIPMMRVETAKIVVATNGKGTYEITDQLASAVTASATGSRPNRLPVFRTGQPLGRQKRPCDAIAWSFTLHDAVLGDVGAAVFPG